MEAAAAKPVLRVAAICGSLRKASYNGGLLRAGTLPPCSTFSPLGMLLVLAFAAGVSHG